MIMWSGDKKKQIKLLFNGILLILYQWGEVLVPNSFIPPCSTELLYLKGH